MTTANIWLHPQANYVTLTFYVFVLSLQPSVILDLTQKLMVLLVIIVGNVAVKFCFLPNCLETMPQISMLYLSETFQWYAETSQFSSRAKEPIVIIGLSSIN